MSLHNSDGSAEWVKDHGVRQGKTSLICSVNGPLEVKSRDELPTQATVELIFRPAIGLTTIREVLIQDQIYASLQSVLMRRVHPRSLYQIVIQVLDSGEPLEHTIYELAGGINVTSLALVNAGIPLSGLVAASALAIVDGQVKANPTPDDLAVATSTHCVAYSFKNGPENPEQKLVLCESLGKFTEEELLAVLKAADQSCASEYNELRQKISADVEQSFPWKA